MEADNFRQKNTVLRKIMDKQKLTEIELESVVRERTTELMKVNQGLETEISERMLAEQALIDAENNLKASYDMLEKSFKGTISTISKIVEMRDPYYQGHHLRTADLARSIAVEMKLSEDQIQAIYFASIVYGIGNIRIPQESLSRSGKLSEIELKVVKTYPQNGYDILKSIEFPWPIADSVLQHHEYIDGSGYPFGLKGDEIMQEAQILRVAATVEAMSSRRPYRPPFNLETTVEQLKQRSGVLYGSRSVDACLAVIGQGRFTPREDYTSATQSKAGR
jgi:HD-GYP domain-containing protein (c-di-GMP phosphodiesterase class II)